MREVPIMYNVIRKAKYIQETSGPIKWTEFKEKENLGDYSKYLESDIRNWE